MGVSGCGLASKALGNSAGTWGSVASVMVEIRSVEAREER